MKKLIVVLFVFFGVITVNAQLIHFFKSYGNTGYDYGRDIKQTSDTGYIATGSSSSFGSGDADAFLLKVDSLGNFKWSHNYGGPGSDWGQAVVITEDSSYAIGGYTNSFGAGGFDFYLVRADINGLPLWEKTYGGSDWDKSNDMAKVIADSGFVLVGETFSYGAGGRDVYIVRTNKYGDTLWTKTFGGASDDYANSVIIDGDSIVICGGTESFGAGMSDGLVIKMGLDGNIGWTRNVGKTNEDYFNSIIKYSNYYVLGGARSYDFINQKKDQWVYKLTENNVQVFDSLYDYSDEDDEINSLYVRGNQDIVTVGYSKSWGYLDGYGDAFLTKYNSAFVFITSVTYGEAGADNAYAIEVCFDDGFVMIGDIEFNSTGGNNLFIIKYNYLYEHLDIYTEVQLDDITLGVSDDAVSSEYFEIYPIPFHDGIIIKGAENVTAITVFDLSGKNVFQSDNCDDMINLGFLNSGLYLLSIETETGTTIQKIVKE